jgi:GT2 family glycosyltransferase
MQSSGIALSVIIVNWNSCDFLRKCLRSIEINAGQLALEVVVVDNASFDGSGEMVAREFSWVKFIQNDKNQGYAHANNLGYQHSQGRNLLFLNPDTEVIGEALTRLTKVVETMPKAGVIGARLLNHDATLQTSCVQAFPSILNQVLDFDAFRHKFPKSSLWGNGAIFESHKQPVVVEGISGACMAIKRSVFESVNLFSTEYFMYSEDLDLCYKTARAGLNNYYVSDAAVMHYGGRSSNSKPESNFSTVMMRESLQKFFRIRKGRLHAFAYRLAMGVAAVCRVTIIGVMVLVSLRTPRRASLGAAFSKWVGVLRWSVGLEGWAKTPA